MRVLVYIVRAPTTGIKFRPIKVILKSAVNEYLQHMTTTLMFQTNVIDL